MYNYDAGLVRRLKRDYLANGLALPERLSSRSLAEEQGLLPSERWRTQGHTMWVRAAKAAAAALSPDVVGAAFLRGLKDRRLDLLSGIGSFALLQHLRPHDEQPGSSGCGYCGLAPEEPVDLLELAVQRLCYGGLNSERVDYATFDLEQLSGQVRWEEAGDADMRSATSLLRQVLETVVSAPTDARPAAVAKTLVMIDGNQFERLRILDLLIFSGVLLGQERLGFARSFTPSVLRQPPDRRTDLEWPTCWWRAGAGLDEHVAKAFFPALD